MKRSLAFLLVLVMVLSLFGCKPNGPAESKPEETKATEGKTEPSETEKQTDAPGTEKSKEDTMIKLHQYEFVFKSEMWDSDRNTVQRGPGVTGATLSALGHKALFCSQEQKGKIKLEDVFEYFYDQGDIYTSFNNSLWFTPERYEITDKTYGTSESGVDYIVVSGNMTESRIKYDKKVETNRDFSMLIFWDEKNEWFVSLFGLAVDPSEEHTTYEGNKELFDACYQKDELYDIMVYAGDHLKYNDRLFD